MTKLAASVARNLDRMTLDDEHLERTEAMRRIRPMGITHGLSQGLTGFGINLLGAVSGIARHALEAKSSVEVFTGLGKGIIGVVAKPISGAAELLALTGQGVLQTVGFNAMPMPRETKRFDEQSPASTITKITWDFIAQQSYDNVLAVAPATYICKNGVHFDATIAITQHHIIVVHWLEKLLVLRLMSSLKVMTASIDSHNATQLILSNDIECSHEQLHRKRILQYLSKTHVQTLESRLGLDEEIQSTFMSTKERYVLACNDSQIASYLQHYIEFLQYALCCTNNTDQSSPLTIRVDNPIYD